MKVWGGVQKVSELYEKNKSLNKVGKASPSAPKKDAVSISNRAKDFQIVMKALKDVPDVRVEKVEEIKGRYESGGYKVSTLDVADRIVRSVADR